MFNDDFGVISAERSFERYSEEHRMTKLNDVISLSELKTISRRFSIKWTKTFEGKKYHTGSKIVYTVKTKIFVVIVL